MYWTPIVPACPKCGLGTKIEDVFAAADGEMLFACHCVTCDVGISWRVYATALALQALLIDLKSEKAPLLLPAAPKPVFTADDDALLKSMNIGESGNAQS